MAEASAGTTTTKQHPHIRASRSSAPQAGGHYANLDKKSRNVFYFLLFPYSNHGLKIEELYVYAKLGDASTKKHREIKHTGGALAIRYIHSHSHFFESKLIPRFLSS